MTNSTETGPTAPHQPDLSRIVVGVDGSEFAVNALRHARRLADALDVPLEAVAVWVKASSMYDFYESQSGWTPEKDIEKLLSDAATAAFGTDIPRRFTTTVLQGPPARTLIRHSAGAEMLVLGGRGHGGFTGLLLGSVSSVCVAHASCPVLVVHRSDRAPVEAETSTVRP